MLKHSFMTFVNWRSSANLKVFMNTQTPFRAQKRNVPVSTSSSQMPADIASMSFWWLRSTELPETCATSWKCSMNSAIWGLSL
jgi:hypothetical protein